jgi:hypothetical protein
VSSFRRHLVAPPARRLLSEAGPPTLWVLVAWVLASALAWILLVQPGPDPRVAVAIAVVIVTIPSVLDVDGWRIRLGMCWLGAEQGRRMPDIGRTPADADRWLARTGDDAHPLEQASMHLLAGRASEARALVEAAPRDDLEDRARIARMLAAIDGMVTGIVDQGDAQAAIKALPPDQRRYHLMSLAWSTAWVAALHRRPWRHDFAIASRGIGPTDVPGRALVWAAVMELLAPLVLIAFLAFGRLVGAW